MLCPSRPGDGIVPQMQTFANCCASPLAYRLRWSSHGSSPQFWVAVVGSTLLFCLLGCCQLLGVRVRQRCVSRRADEMRDSLLSRTGMLNTGGP